MVLAVTAVPSNSLMRHLSRRHRKTAVVQAALYRRQRLNGLQMVVAVTAAAAPLISPIRLHYRRPRKAAVVQTVPCLRFTANNEVEPVRETLIRSPKQVREFRNIRGDPSGFVLRQTFHRHSPPGFVLIVDVSQRLSVGISNAKRFGGGVVHSPRRGESAAFRHHLTTQLPLGPQVVSGGHVHCLSVYTPQTDPGLGG
jgi:hypothetical protein